MSKVFLSHSTQDKEFVDSLRKALESHGIDVWMDTRELSAVDALTPEIQRNIEQAHHVLVVFSVESINSDWVLNEIDWAQEHGKKIIPLCFPEVKHTLVKRLLGKDALILTHDSSKPIDLILPDLLVALGQQLPEGFKQATQVEEKPLAELLLKLYEPEEIFQEDNSRRYSARAELIYSPADGSHSISSPRFKFTAPLGAIEAEDLRWYLEQYLG